VIVAYTMPLWTVLFGRLLVGEQITRSRLAALLLGLTGMAVLLAPDARTLWAAPAGTVLMVGAAVSWAIGTVLTKARRWTIATTVLTGWQLVLGAVPIVLGALLRLGRAGDTDPGSQLGLLSHGAILGTAYATFVGVIFCHWAWFRLVAILPSAVAAIATLGIPIVGLFGSALVLGEPVGHAEIAALILVVSGLAILIGGLRGGWLEVPPGRATVSTRGRAWR
jgi:drug/metabolite transporter (DMT)-like permease